MKNKFFKDINTDKMYEVYYHRDGNINIIIELEDITKLKPGGKPIKKDIKVIEEKYLLALTTIEVNRNGEPL